MDFFVTVLMLLPTLQAAPTWNNQNNPSANQQGSWSQSSQQQWQASPAVSGGNGVGSLPQQQTNTNQGRSSASLWNALWQKPSSASTASKGQSSGTDAQPKKQATVTWTTSNDAPWQQQSSGQVSFKQPPKQTQKQQTNVGWTQNGADQAQTQGQWQQTAGQWNNRQNTNSWQQQQQQSSGNQWSNSNTQSSQSNTQQPQSKPVVNQWNSGNGQWQPQPQQQASNTVWNNQPSGSQWNAQGNNQWNGQQNNAWNQQANNNQWNGGSGNNGQWNAAAGGNTNQWQGNSVQWQQQAGNSQWSGGNGQNNQWQPSQPSTWQQSAPWQPNPWNKKPNQPMPTPPKPTMPTMSPTPDATDAPTVPATIAPTTSTTTATTTSTTTSSQPMTMEPMATMKPKMIRRHPMVYFPANKCKSGTRRSVMENIDAFEVCDNGEWVFMLCAPGTWFDTEFMECTDGYNLAPSWPISDEMMMALANGEIPAVAGTGNGAEPAGTDGGSDMMASYADPDVQQQEGMQMEMDNMMATQPMMNNNQQQGYQQQGYQDPNLWVDDVREIIVISVEKCKVGRTREDDDLSKYQECIMSPAGQTLWILRNCAPGALFSPWTKNCGKYNLWYNDTNPWLIDNDQQQQQQQQEGGEKENTVNDVSNDVMMMIVQGDSTNGQQEAMPMVMTEQMDEETTMDTNSLPMQTNDFNPWITAKDNKLTITLEMDKLGKRK